MWGVSCENVWSLGKTRQTDLLRCDEWPWRDFCRAGDERQCGSQSRYGASLFDQLLCRRLEQFQCLFWHGVQRSERRTEIPVGELFSEWHTIVNQDPRRGIKIEEPVFHNCRASSTGYELGIMRFVNQNLPGCVCGGSVDDVLFGRRTDTFKRNSLLSIGNILLDRYRNWSNWYGELDVQWKCIISTSDSFAEMSIRNTYFIPCAM